MRQLLPWPADEIDPVDAYVVDDGELPSDRPHLRANMVASADGAMSVDGRSGPLSGTPDRRIFSLLRDLSDVILVGAGTVAAERYGPARPSAERQFRRIERGLAPVPSVAVVTANLDLDLDSPFFTRALVQPILLTCATAVSDRRMRRYSQVARVIVTGEEAVDLPAALGELDSAGARRVLCEGGPMLLANLFAAGCVDELCLTIAPLLAGPGARRIVDGAALPGAPDRMRVLYLLEEGDTIFFRYQVRGCL